MTTATLVCLVVHCMISRQKQMAFERIENSVITHLDIKKETLKQVYIYLLLQYYNASCMHSF